MKVLILGVAPVQMDALNCLNEMGVDTYAVARANDGPGSSAAGEFEIIDFSNETLLEQYVLDKGINVIYSVGSDLAMPIACRISEKLGLPHFIPSEVATICNNKNLLRQTLGPDFSGNIEFQVFSGVNQAIQLPFPFIMKPADSQGQRGVRLINNERDFLSAFPVAQANSRTRLVMIEKYIDGPEFSVNGHMAQGELLFCLISDRHTWPQFTGLVHRHLAPTRILTVEHQTGIKYMLKEAFKKIGLTDGPFYAQIKILAEKPRIVEITPRVDGCHLWKPIKYHTGINLLRLTFEHLLSNSMCELEQLKHPAEDKYTLEFLCQKPQTPANYSDVKKGLDKSIDYFFYYNQGDIIKTVNDQYEKIGYMIYQD